MKKGYFEVVEIPFFTAFTVANAYYLIDFTS